MKGGQGKHDRQEGATKEEVKELQGAVETLMSTVQMSVDT